MPLVCANNNLIAVAINKEVKWRGSSSQIFNTLIIPFEVNFDNAATEIEHLATKSSDHFIKDLVFSEDGTRLAVLSSYKEFFIYSTENFSLLCKHLLPRAASKVTFSFDSRFLLIADKTGDVLLFNTHNQGESGKKIFGHLSLLTDILMSRNNKYIITCDRDEKIKVSNYPGSYNIESFCLGHREFVTSIHFLPHNEKYLVSASGDGSVKIWNYLLGKEMVSINVHCDSDNSEVFDTFKQVMKVEDVEIECLPINYASCCKVDDHSSLLAVSLHLNKSIMVYKISGQEENMKYNCNYQINLEHYPLGFVVSKDNVLVSLDGDKKQLQEWKLKEDGKVEKGFCEIFENLNTRKKENADGISVLYKRKFDNLQEYQNRKKKRIEGNI